MRSINSNNNIIIIVYAWFRERDHKKRTLTRMISPSWKSLRRARTKKITTIGKNKVSNSLRARRVEHTALQDIRLIHLFSSCLFLSFDKGTKCLNRLADVYHNFLRASRVLVVVAVGVTAIATANHVERSSSPFLGPLWLYTPCL